MNILEELAALARERVKADRARIPETEMHDLAVSAGKGGGEQFTAALRKPGISFICEIKRASPSKGLIAPDFPYTEIAREYEAAGADCVSCLTEPHYFLGSDDIFREVRQVTSLPMIRKDFTVSLYQLDQARVMGADAALLIVSMMDREMLESCLRRCNELGIAALTETHDEAEIRTAVDAGAQIIGVNNRNLKDFSVDTGNSGRLRSLVPKGIIFVAESGIKTAEDVAALRRAGVNAVLVGEALMTAPDKRAALDTLRGGD